MSTFLILQQPDDDSLQPAGNDSYFTVSADTLTTLGGITEYKYVADVYINTNLVATQKSFPDPDFKIGVFNLRNIPSSFIKSYIDFTYDYTTTLSTLFGEVVDGDAQVVLNIGEEYLLNGVFTSNKNVLQSNEPNYINASFDFLDSDQLSFNTVYQIYPSGATDGYFLGSFGPVFDTKDNLTWPEIRQYLYFYLNEDNAYNLSAEIITYNFAGTMVGKYRTVATATTFTSGNKGLKYLACGYSQLQNLVSSQYTVLSGASTIINANVASYTVSLRNASPGGALPAYARFTVKQSCDKYKRWNVYWLTQAGNFNSWRFDKQSMEKVTKTQSEFKKIYGKLGSNGSYTVNSFDRNAQTFYTTLENNISLSTDFLTDAQVLYLKDLFSSPEIYLEDLDGSGKIVAASITDNDYTLNKRVNKKVYSLKINFKLAFNDYRQIA